MSRLLTAAVAALALALAACAPQIDPALKKTFDACTASAASQFPDTCRPGEVCADVRQIEGIGNAMESCMTGFGYKYDESKAGCQLPPPYNARFYQLKSEVSCYSSVAPK
jgi:hypothetical protein